MITPVGKDGNQSLRLREAADFSIANVGPRRACFMKPEARNL